MGFQIELSELYVYIYVYIYGHNDWGQSRLKCYSIVTQFLLRISWKVKRFAHTKTINLC